MTAKIFVHGSGHRADSWNAVLACLADGGDALCPDLRDLLGGQPATYENLCAAFADYCGRIEGPVHLCGLSLGGILALQYALDCPGKVRTLVLIGTPCKVPKIAFRLQNLVFRLLPDSLFRDMAFGKADTFALGSTMKDLDFTARLQAVRCPTLILCGEKDSANRKAAFTLAKGIPGAKLKILKGAGHVVNEDCPRALADVLAAFYARHA